MTSRPAAGFVHLHVHTEFSPIDALSKVKDVVTWAQSEGHPAIAVTDHGTLGGLWKLQQYATAAGVKPILGVEAYVAIGSRFEKNAVEVTEDGADPDPEGGTGTKRKTYEHLTLLAATSEGWQNLVQIMNASHDSLWYKPRLDYELLEQHSAGLICLTGCLGGPVAGPMARAWTDGGTLRHAELVDWASGRDGRILNLPLPAVPGAGCLDLEGGRQAVANLRRLVDIFGPDRVFVEVMEHGIPAETAAAPSLAAVAEHLDVRLVATNDSHYIHATQFDAHDAWLAVGVKKELQDGDRFQFHGDGYHLRTEAEMRALRPEPWWQEACDNTVVVADMVGAAVMPTPRLRLPRYPLPDGFSDSATYLKHLVREGARARYGTDPARPEQQYLPPEVNARLKFEFGVVDAAGLSDYFLIEWDVLDWARSDRGLPTAEHPRGEPGRKKPIRVGPGRGSAAGSVMSYALKIVNVDPLANHLLFERFLNPARTGMPDIDVDFEQGRRGEVLRYMAARFGEDRVAQIGTFGIARSKAAIKDAARVLRLTALGERLSSLVPIEGGKPMSFAALDNPKDRSSDAFRQAVASGGDNAAAILELARQFEDVTKQEGVHACGTLVADEPMAPIVPLRNNLSKDAGPDPLKVTVWDGKDVDAYGLLKMDVLGLRNLDVISRAVDFIEQTTGELVDPDALIPNDPRDADRDARAWALIAAGRTAGVFQLESAGMTKLAEQVAPSSLADLTALVALFRPGPLAAGMHEHYAARKHGREQVDYGYLTSDPAEQSAIASVLGETYGVVAYQEQLMRLGEVVGGLDAAMRNKLQKAFSKKKADLMAEVKDAMFAGGLAGTGTSGVRFSQATLDALWVTFEGSASYLFNASHACAYGYVAYMTAYLKANWPVQYGAAILAVTDDDDKRHAAIRSLQLEGVPIQAPDINRSAVGTTPDGDAVLLGLSEVKGVGKNAVHIVADREANGPYLSVSDVIARVRVPGRAKDGSPTSGAVPVNTIEALIEAGAFDAMGPRMGQAMIARALRKAPEVPPIAAEWGVLERAARQRARLGLTAGEHPLVTLREQVSAYTAQRPGSTPVRSVASVNAAANGARVCLLGVLSAWAEKPYRRGRMVTLAVEGSAGAVEGVIWEEDRSRLSTVPRIGDVVVLTGQVRVRVVETEQIGEDGETVTESFERRDLTVTTVETVPIDDPAMVELPEGGRVPIDATAAVADIFDNDPGDSSEPSSPVVDLEAEARVPTQAHAPAAENVETVQPVRAETWTGVGAEHLGVCDLPAGFDDAGAWLVCGPGARAQVVVVGRSEAPDAAHLPMAQPGWVAVHAAASAA